MTPLTYKDWLKTRPSKVRRFARETKLKPGDKLGDYWFLGFSEWADGGVGLIVSQRDPFGDRQAYEAAYGARQHICPACAATKRWEPCWHEDKP